MTLKPQGSGMNAADRDQIIELLAMPELQAGFATLAQNLPGFQSFVDSMLPPTDEPATTTTTEAAGMVRHKVVLYESYNIGHIFHIWFNACSLIRSDFQLANSS